VKGEKVLEVRKLCTNLLDNVTFSAFRGERLGFAGLIGAGRTEVVRAIFGADHIVSGEVFLNGKKMEIHEPSDAIRNGIALIPEDRKRQGALLHMSVGENISIVKLGKFSLPGGFILRGKEKVVIDRYIRELRIKTPTSVQLVKNLSGGNQQKVVLAKWLLVESDVIIFDEPTRGIDVGAKQEIYSLINSLAEAGKVIILISSEMPELLGMSDRIIVMAEGRITGELDVREATQEKIMQLSSI
jgi:ribose transport system ATP-binding protein